MHPKMWPLVFLLAAPSLGPASPADVVQRFYESVIRDHPIGIPKNQERRTLWPLMSARLRRHLDGLQACEDDYFRRHKAVLEAEQLKPEIGWLEYGLFSGGEEMALPAEAVIARVEPAGQAAFRVHVTFTYKETATTALRPPDPANTFHWSGIVVVASEGGRYVFDDFIPLDRDSGKPLPALTRDFQECKGGRWVRPRRLP